MITVGVINEYIERINDVLRIVGVEDKGYFSFEYTDNNYVLKSGTDVLFISDDIELFFAYVSFWWVWVKRNRLNIS